MHSLLNYPEAHRHNDIGSRRLVLSTEEVARGNDRSRCVHFLEFVRLLAQASRCGATRVRNSREEISLVFFQYIGKCRWLPVNR